MNDAWKLVGDEVAIDSGELIVNVDSNAYSWYKLVIEQSCIHVIKTYLIHPQRYQGMLG